MYHVSLTERAESDVDGVLRWFRDQKATDAGRRWFSQLLSKLDALKNHPERCAIAPESDDVGEEIRELLLGRGRYKYRILFKVSVKTVIILRVWHSSRDSMTPADLNG